MYMKLRTGWGGAAQGEIKSYTSNEGEFLGELSITMEVFGYFH